jgi:hypothetical protein
VKLNELNLTNVLGDYGAAAVKQAGNRLTGKAEGNLSVQDKIAKEKFISNFIGRASTNLNSAIQSGLVDPNIKAGAAGAVEPQQDATPKPGANVSQQPTTQPTTQQPATSTEPKSPEQIRKEKQALAGQVAQQNMASNPAPTTPQTPEQIRQAKQATATQTAQSQMAANPAPTQQSKMTPQQVAALKGKLKAGATPTSGQSGFKNYVGGSGERMTGVDKSGAPVYQKIQRESRYAKLDYILESIINIDEAQEAQSISEYLQNMFNQYLGVPITDPKAKAQIKTLADQAQASYPKMTNALTQMANLGFAISYSQGKGATQDAGATTSQPTSAMDAIKAGVQQGLGNTPSASGSTATPSTTSNTSAAGGSAYDQAIALVSKLSSEEKQKLLATLQEPAAGGQGAFDQMGKQLQQPKATTNPVDNRQQKLNVNKIKSGNKGAPTPDEEAKLQQRIQQQLAAQA